MSRPQRFWLIGIVFLLALGGALFVSQLEKVEEEVRFGPNAEARANPRLAAMRLLENYGIEARVARDPAVLPAAGSIVLLPSDVFLDLSRVGRWRDWVEGGGTLVLGLDLPPETRERLLGDTAAVEKFAPGGEEGEEGEPGEPAGEPDAEPDAEIADPETAPAHDELDAGNQDDYWTFGPLTADEEPEIRLAMRPKWVIPRQQMDRVDAGYYLDEGGLVGVFKVGAGFLVLLADDRIFSNERIAEQDHAYFLWHLVTYFGEVPEVVVVLGDRIGFLAWLWRAAWPLLVPLFLLTLIFIWEKAPRFGPPILLRPPGQRGLRAHLRAASAFLWRRHRQAALLEPLRAEVLRRAGVAIPGWAGFGAEKARAELARIAHLPEPAIDAALRGEPGRDPRNFVALVATLETLRKAL